MATVVSYNGSNFSIPANREARGWGASLTNFLLEVAEASFTPAGGNYRLQADLNLGSDGVTPSSYGLVALYYKSVTANIAQSGQLRLARADTIAWRNQANGADLALGVDSGNRLEFNSVDLVTVSSTDTLTNKSIDADQNTITNIDNADIKAGAAIDATKIADGSVTNTEFQYIGGLTSDAQTQLNGKEPTISAGTTGQYWRGDKSWQTLDKSAVGLGNVDNTSDATKNSATATLTNKTLDNPIIDNSLTMLHESTPANPSAGQIRVYPKSDNRLYTLDSSGVETVVGSGAAGGFVNYITNPDAESSTTGWSTYADAAASTPADGTGGSPNVTWTRNTSSPIRGNADFAFAKDAANRQGQGVSFAFTLATTDRSKKCQISFDYDTSAANYAAGDMRVYVYDVTNATLITPQTVDIPKGTNTFKTTFDTTTSTSYRLILHVATTNATAYTVDFDNFVVNAGQVDQGAAISSPQSWTPTGSWVSNATYSGRKWREGSIGHYEVKIVLSGAPTSASLTINMPSGETIDTSALLSTYASAQLGQGVARDTGTDAYILVVGYSSATAVSVFSVSADTTYARDSAATTQAIPFTFGNTDEIYVRWSVPIAEWAGNGTVNLGPGAQVEYAATSGTWDADSSTTVYGPAGQAIGGTLTNARTKTVTWQYPVQPDDLIVVEGSRDGVYWAPLNGYRFASTVIIPGVDETGNISSGVLVHQTSATQTVVTFSQYANIANDNAPLTNWPSSNAFWRVRKAKASSPVGFGLAGTDGSSGLYQAGRAPGLTTGATIASGMVGEILTASMSAVSVPATGTRGDVATLTLTAGIWEVSANAVFNRNGASFSSTYLQLSIITAAGNSSTGEVTGHNALFQDSAVPTTFNRFPMSIAPIRVVCDGTNIIVAGTTTAGLTLRLKCFVSAYTVATPQIDGIFKAVRIA